MFNELDGTENDQAWAALTANDPTKLAADPALDAIKASVLTEATKVVPITKRSWLAPVAVAASVALFVGGGAGYTIAAQSAVGPSNSISAPALEMGGAAPEDAKMSSIWGGRPFLEAGSGISDRASTQIGYTLDAGDIDRKSQLQVIADVFEVDGKISGSKVDGFFVGDQNYVNAIAQISGSSWDLSQLVTWNYSDSSVNPQYCGENFPMYDTQSGNPGVAEPSVVNETDVVTPEPMPTIEPDPAPSECGLPEGVLPTDESALSLAKEKFQALGFDSASANWSVADGSGMWGFGSEFSGAYKLVTAKVMVDGFDSKQSWTMTVGPDGTILSANGFYAEFVPTAAYDIVGARTAIERSQNSLWTNLSAQEVYKDGMIYPMDREVSQENQASVKRNSNGQPILDANVDRVTISNAEKSLVLWYLNDGSTILLPAYLLSESSSDDSRQWLQLAIADKYVDFN
jgi:hypothetical protein